MASRLTVIPRALTDDLGNLINASNGLYVRGAGTAGSPAAGVDSVQGVSGGTPISTSSWAFDVVAAPAVTAGAYGPGDIMGALMTFSNVAQAVDQGFILQKVEFAFKSAVTPSLTLIIFNADPVGTTKTDNAVYSLATTDTFKVVTALPINALGGYLVDHGTPNTIELGNLAIPMKPISGTRDIYALLVDLTGVTLSSTSDLQVRLAGI